MKIFIQAIVLLTLTLNVYSNTTKATASQQGWFSFDEKSKYSAKELLLSKQTLNLGVEDALIIKSEFSDESGFKHFVCQQTYKNIPIQGATLIIHERNNIVENANGKLQHNFSINVTPKITADNAFQFALSQLNADKYAWQEEAYENMLQQANQNEAASFYPKGKLVIFNPEFNYENKLFKLVYKFDVYAIEPMFRKWVYVDANTGAVLKTINKIHNCNHHQVSGNTNYSGNVNFSACKENNTYHLKSEQNCHIEVFSSNWTDKNLPVGFEENTSQFNNSRSAVEVFWTLQEAYDYFKNTLGLSGIDGNNLPIYSWVNYKENFNNAFWNGTWLTFGEGDGKNYGAFTSPDIVAHEYMHGITDHSPNGLAYYGESGALNESFSDIFGEVIEHYMFGTNDWVLGADIVITPGKAGLRSMADPTSSLMTTQQPAAYEGPYWYNGFADNGGVHINSGVQNYWFYLLSEGGKDTNFEGDYYDIEGIGIEKAAAIAYKNLTTYLTENATYIDAYFGSILAAEHLYGKGSNEVAQTKAAWCAVNLGNTCIKEDDPNDDCDRNLDSLALIALYNSTNGNNWNNKWNLNHPVETWYGVDVNSKGCARYINLHNNNLTGTLPIELGNLKHVKTLRLSTGSSSTGKITGNLPVTIGEMEALQVLNLGYQNLEGTLPSEMVNLKYLQTLALAGNNFSGNMPAFLNNITTLQEIDLANNNFSGTLPDLNLLQTLIILDLGYNNFSGTIPASFANLIQLESLTLRNNNMGDCFPGSLVALCSHLSSGNNTNQWISDNNNFNEDWEDFCLNGAGSCDGESIIGPVYPGDFNQNGLVEISDLLYWGLAFEETGAQRPGATNNWVAQDCVEWQNFVNGVNNKHQDANGDGLVDQQDVGVFIQNYDLGAISNSNNQSNSLVKYVLEPVSSTKNAGEIMVTYNLKVESLTNQAVTAHGLACKINFSNLNLNSVTVNFENTCLEQTEHLSIYDVNNNELNIAITKKDKTIEICENIVARLTIVVMEELQSGEPYIIAINNGNTISNTGQLSAALNQTMYGMLSFSQSATTAFTTQVQTTNEQCNALGNAVVDAVGGIMPYTYSWSNGATTAEVNNLPAGNYTVTVSDAANNSNTINIEIGSPLPVFDYQTGEQLCGQNCAETLDLNGTVNGGYYKAAQQIESNGTLNVNSQIQYKAGNRIRLNTGFSTSQSDRFSATIGNCNE